MAQVTITANNTRINDAQSNSGWSNEGGGGPSPAAEPQLKYTLSNAVNRKVTATTARQGVQYNAGSTNDMTAAANALWLAKVYVADFGDLNGTWGVELGIGSASSARYEYNVAGTGANRDVFASYPAAGGYLILALSPNVAAWREASIGSPALTAVDHYEVACQFISGGAKSENVAMSAIDVGTGLTLTGGDGGDPDGTFADFVDADQNTVSNRWGYASEKDGAITFRGMMTIGGAAATVFTDNNSKVSFPDGYHAAGLFGITVDLQNAGSIITMGAAVSGLGSDIVEDTRPDYIVTGTAGSHTLTGTLDNFRQVTLTSGVSVDGATLSVSDLTQGGASITGARLLMNAVSGAAVCDDADFTLISDCDVIQAGSGHAFEINTPGTYSFSGLTFDGFGADGANDAAVFNNSGGLVTLNISGGDTPTVRNGAGASTVINNTVSVTLTGLFSGTRIKVYRASDNAELGGVESSGASFAIGLDAGVDVVFRLISLARMPLEFDLTVPGSDTTIPVSQSLDRVYENI